MRKVLLLIFVTLLLSHTCLAQQKLALNLGYDYMGRHSGFTGIDYRLNSNAGVNRHGALNVGIGAYLYGKDGRFAIAPEAHLTQTWRHFLLTELSVSTQNIKPSLGLTLFNLGHLKIGYSFPINDADFKGFSIGFHLYIGRSSFYDEIKLF